MKLQKKLGTVKTVSKKQQLPPMLVGRYLMVYGAPRTGKSTFAAAMVARYGGTVIDYDRDRVPSEIEGPVVVVDTLTSLATYELDRLLKKQGVESLGDISWGRGKQYYAKRIRTVLGEFTSPDWLTIVLAHKFADHEMTLPHLPSGFEEYVLVKTDATILYRKAPGGKRQFVFTSLSPAIEAGCRDGIFAKAETTVAGADGDSAVDAFMSAVAD